jgi:hypothetical protein
MNRLPACVVLLSVGLAAQPPSMESTFLALKDPHATRGVLSDQLALEMMLLSKKGASDRSLSQVSVERFSQDLTTALLGKDITTIRASALQKSIAGVLSGKGSTFLPASRFRQALASCGVEDHMVQAIVDQLTHIGQDVRGPDDLGVRPFKVN